ncbi:6-carboxytetrahydropterin synthase [Parasulfuritortus cantonensis]|uniref:6-carboxy-5,6,7,8-tetrahydropterin synthase n=1 Tax=Parasulfuritortus cantonensis TaxID=2528202 RepID=A0A4R1B6L0_9PROT|nr:6-carboxytetrahydropterin synthase [Parasulfuritortus cantonensis]
MAAPDNRHLHACSGLTLQEYALRHALPLDRLVGPDALGEAEVAPLSAGTVPDEPARAVLAGLRLAGRVAERGTVCRVEGEVAWLDLLFWDLARLAPYGFRYRQEYLAEPGSHRVMARNRLVAHKRNLVGAWPPATEPPPPPALKYATYVAHAAELHAGYLFLPFVSPDEADDAAQYLARDLAVRTRRLDAGQPLLRTLALTDTERLLAGLEAELTAMPGVWARFHPDTPTISVTKEVVFDAAHFLTDHPAKCRNLHGGRYVLQVEVRGPIDPATGCLLDYGYLKRVVNARVVEDFDHHTLNYATPDLAWRSTTELICVYIWERLIDYLPGLASLTLYETPQSWCRYSGPDLAAWQALGKNPLLGRFTDPALGRSPWRPWQDGPEPKARPAAPR